MAKRTILQLAAVMSLVALVLGAVPAALDGRAAPGDGMTTVNGVVVDSSVAAIWASSDGPVAANLRQRSWVWGPTALAATTEYSAESPNGIRHMVYFDKGRMDILDGSLPADSPWYVTGALLVTQMISGRIPFGPDDGVDRPAPTIAVAGDLDQPAPLTYAALAHVASVDGWSLNGGGIAVGRADSRVGQAVTAALAADGSVESDGADDRGVVVSDYDSVTGHNVADPFAHWASGQGVDALWLVGRPLTEPFWIDTVIGGEPQRILLQAFERRVLTFAPDQPQGWTVESNNAGSHYRLWRGLVQPEGSGAIALASHELFGEEIVASAVQRGADPVMVAAIVRSSSGGNPLATQPNGALGLMSIRPDIASELGGGDLHDPRLNTLLGAGDLARLAEAHAGDTRATLDAYFGAGAASGLVDATLDTYNQLSATYADGSDTTSPVPTSPGGEIAAGQAAYYSQSYDRAWWERTLQRYAGYGAIAASWQNDPNGYYCVRPGFIPGQLLRLEANGISITCTVGDTVAAGDVASWYAHWAIELNWDAFVALGLDHQNQVTVFQVGPVG